VNKISYKNVYTGLSADSKPEEKFDIRYPILLFMVAVYPLLVLPDPMVDLLSLPANVPPNYFLGARYIILAAISVLSLIFLIKERMIVYHHSFILLAFFIIFMIISAVHAPNPIVAWMGLPTRLTGVVTYLFCIILFMLALGSNSTDKLLDYMVIAAAIVSITAVLQYFGVNIVPHDPYWDRFISYGTMDHPNRLGTYTSFLLPAAVIKYIQSKKNFWLVMAGIIYSGLLVSLSRGAWIAFFVVMVIIGIHVWKRSRQSHLYARIILLFIIITIILLPMRNGTLMNRFVSVTGDKGIGVSDNSGSYRIIIWKETSKLFLDNFLFGIGPDHLIYKEIVLPDSTYVAKAHNIFLEIAVTMGIFTLISHLVFLSCFFRDFKNEKTFVFKIMILSYLVQGQFSVDVLMVIPIYWILLGLTIASQKVEQKLLPS
jgi:O-antigen ligase